MHNKENELEHSWLWWSWDGSSGDADKEKRLWTEVREGTGETNGESNLFFFFLMCKILPGYSDSRSLRHQKDIHSFIIMAIASPRLKTPVGWVLKDTWNNSIVVHWPRRNALKLVNWRSIQMCLLTGLLVPATELGPLLDSTSVFLAQSYSLGIK